MTRISIAAFIVVITCLAFAFKYRKALPQFDGWNDAAHRIFKTVLAVVMICCVCGCAALMDTEAKRAELKKQLGDLGTSAVVSLVTGNPLPAIGGAVNFMAFLFGGLGTAYGIKQRHKIRQAIDGGGGSPPSQTPVLLQPGQVAAGPSQTPVLLPAGGGQGYTQNPTIDVYSIPGGTSQTSNGGRVAA